MNRDHPLIRCRLHGRFNCKESPKSTAKWFFVSFLPSLSWLDPLLHSLLSSKKRQLLRSKAWKRCIIWIRTLKMIINQMSFLPKLCTVGVKANVENKFYLVWILLTNSIRHRTRAQTQVLHSQSWVFVTRHLSSRKTWPGSAQSTLMSYNKILSFQPKCLSTFYHWLPKEASTSTLSMGLLMDGLTPINPFKIVGKMSTLAKF